MAIVALKQRSTELPAESETTGPIELVRYGCAIGAMQSAAAIPRVVPIAHCGPGCADKQSMNLAFYNGFQSSGWGGGPVTPSTNASQREVIFGGADRLRELIESTLQVLDADLFVVLTGCIPDLVGDDVGSVVREFQKRDVPIVFAETGGFRGNNFTGHEAVTQAIIEQYVGSWQGERQAGLVNLWSLMPFQNTFWRGDLEEIKRLLEGIGLRVNVLFGPDCAGVAEWKSIPSAQFNLVLSPWLGLATVKLLQQKYGQPFLHIPVVPIGARQSTTFLREVARFAGLASEPVETFIADEERRYYNYIDGFTDFYSEYWWGLPAKFAVAGDSAYNLALTKFLVCQLGLIPACHVITEDPPTEHRESIRAEFRAIDHDVSVEVAFEDDSHVIHQLIRESDFGQKPPIVFGTTWERDLVKELKGSLVEVGSPPPTKWCCHALMSATVARLDCWSGSTRQWSAIARKAIVRRSRGTDDKAEAGQRILPPLSIAWRNRHHGSAMPLRPPTVRRITSSPAAGGAALSSGQTPAPPSRLNEERDHERSRDADDAQHDAGYDAEHDDAEHDDAQHDDARHDDARHDAQHDDAADADGRHDDAHDGRHDADADDDGPHDLRDDG
jgi:nitrogenase molybdenum-iron protein beta chain